MCVFAYAQQLWHWFAYKLGICYVYRGFTVAVTEPETPPTRLWKLVFRSRRTARSFPKRARARVASLYINTYAHTHTTA